MALWLCFVQTGLQRVNAKAEQMERKKAELDKIVPWACPLCAHVNVGTVNTCQSMVKSGGREVRFMT